MLVLFTIYLVKLEYFDRHNSHNCILLRTDVVYNNTTIGHATKKTGSSYCAHLHRTNGLLWMNNIILEHLAIWSTMTCFSYLSLHMHEQSSLGVNWVQTGKRRDMEIENSPGSQLKPVVELQEAQEKAGRKKGGWVTLPFIAGAYIWDHLPCPFYDRFNLISVCRDEETASDHIRV